MAKVTKLKLARLTEGGEREYLATWSFGRKHVNNYSVQFQYYAETSRTAKNKKGKIYNVWAWVDGSSSTVTHKQATYSAPEGATKVRVRVKPNSTKTKKKKKKKVYWWTGQYCSYKWAYVYDYYAPEKPSAPTISIEDKQITVSCKNLDSLADLVTFQFVKNEGVGDKGKTWTVDVTPNLNSASYSFDGESGCKYRVRVKARNIVSRTITTGTGKKKKTTVKKYSYWSEYSEYTDNVETAPLPPTNLKVSVKSETSVLLTWTTATIADHYTIFYANSLEELEQKSGESYKTQNTEDNSSSYILTSLNSGEVWYFRVKSVNSNNIESVKYTDTVKVALGGEPEAPTTWSSVSVAYIGETVKLYWVHNSEDGSDQIKANIEGVIDGKVVLNETVNNTKDEYGEYSDKTSVYELNTSSYKDSDELMWRVRTMGVTNKYGEWSVQRSIKLYEKPSLLINVNDKNGNETDIVDQFPINLKLSTGPATQTPIGYNISIISTETYAAVDDTGNTTYVNTGEEVFTRYIEGNGLSSDVSLTLLPSDIDIQNGITYKVTGMASFDSGLSADCPETGNNPETFIVAIEDEQYDINATVEYNEDDMTANISPYCTLSEASGLEFLVDREGDYLSDKDGNFLIGIFSPNNNTEDNPEEVDSDVIDYAEGVTLSVYRRSANGKFVAIATGITNDGTTITDPHPSLDYGRYRVVATSESTGAISYEDIIEPIDETSIIIQWNEEWSDFDGDDEDDETPIWTGSLIKLPYNIDVSESNSLDVSLVSYIGRERPVSYYGTQLGESFSWSCEIAKNDSETLYQLRRLAVYQGDVYVREPSGLGFWAQVSVSFNIKHKSTTVPVTLNIKPVEGGM